MIDTLEASRLVSLGLNARSTPSADAEYEGLVRRFRDEGEFAAQVAAVADGLGLDVLGCDMKTGCLVAPRQESPFAMRLEDYVSYGKAEARMVHGLIQVAIAAWFFPTAASLDNDQIEWLTPTELDDYLRSLCHALGDTEGNIDPEVDLPEIEPAWRIYMRWEAARSTSDGRAHSFSTIRMCEKALGWLADQGLLRTGRAPDGSDGFAPRERFRAQVRELISHPCFIDIHNLIAEGALPSAKEER
jgi:hypothetical protein